MAAYDVVGIGNALVDIITDVKDDFLVANELPKGSMNLVELDRSNALYDGVGAAREVSGGSCGNTMAGLGELGGKGAFIGKVRDDQFGEIFRHDIRSIGVDFDTAPSTEGEATGKCLVLVSDDAERTMCTYLGAANRLTPADVDPAVIQAGKVVYMEGYLFDREEAKQAFVKAAEAAHAKDRLQVHAAETAHVAHTKVSLSLSDSFCVDRHRDSFRHLVANHIDILFANEDELLSLYQVSDFDEAIAHVRKDCDLAAVTRGAAGSVIVSANEQAVIPAATVENVIDTTGAGDQYAAGVLYGLTHDLPLEICGRIGSMMGAEVISHYGARVEADVKAMLADILR